MRRVTDDKSNVHSCSILGQSTSHQNARKKAGSLFYTQYNNHICFSTTETQTVYQDGKNTSYEKEKPDGGDNGNGTGGGGG